MKGVYAQNVCEILSGLEPW